MPQVTFKIEKQAPIISVTNGSSENLELFHGIGNTLGFNITGGSDFSMPITIFHVKEGSRAENAGLKLGDSIVTINEKDTTNMTLQEANNVLEQAAQQDVKLGVIKFDEVDEANPEKKLAVHNVVLGGKRKPRLPFEEELRPPCGAWIEKPERKAWHPIMWPTPEHVQPEVFQKELPHKRIIRNLRRLLTEIADKPAEREKHLEQLLLALPRGSADPLVVVRPKPEPKEGSINVELTIKSMQRQLLLIADKLPDDITLTLLKSFAKILSREPEPSPKTPFIRAFAKIRDDGIDKQFSAIVEEDDEQLKIYESGSGDESGDNECTFNYKVTTTTEQIVYNVSNNDESDIPVEGNADQVTEIDENTENVDEGIEVEMPKLLSSDDSAEAEFAAIANQETSNEDTENLVENQDQTEAEKLIDEETAEAFIEEVEEVVEIEEEPIPAEPPKVTLDDIQREIQEMQMFLLQKGISPEKKKKKAAAVEAENSNGNSNNQVNGDSKNLQDAYQVDVCIKLKNRNDDPEKHERRHHHSKYMRSENYKEEIVDEGPIFDPTIPNTEEDFMKVKSVEERFHRKNQKVQALDNSWQNLCENQKKLYKHSQFEKSKKNVAEQQKNIRFN